MSRNRPAKIVFSTLNVLLMAGLAYIYPNVAEDVSLSAITLIFIAYGLRIL